MGGVAAGSIVPRDDDYMAPVCHHFGYNNLPEGLDKPCRLFGACTLCDPDKIVYIDELDPEDNVEQRYAPVAKELATGAIKPEVQWANDGYLTLTVFIAESERVAEYAALEMARKLGLLEPEVIHKGIAHPAEGTLVELKARLPFSVDGILKIPEASSVDGRPDP